MDVEVWLRQLGLERFAPAFREHEIDDDLLPDLTEADLEKLGLPLGPRNKLLKAIAELGAAPVGPAPVPAQSAAERRQLTVMFCDLVGSTALSRRLDPEELGRLMRAYQNAVAGEVARLEGHVAKYLGDGVLAYFGWPRAHEDAAERAVRAGLAIQEAVGRLAASEPLSARIGIATGLVVVGDLIGEGASREESVVGEAPNLAARLQALAEAGSIVVAESTRRLLGGLFELEDLGGHALRGFEQPVQAWRVLGESSAEGRFEALHGQYLIPLIGREQELALLLERWALARQGEGQVVLLSGEPGIGKSRVVLALRERLRDEPRTSLRYFCSPYHTNSALFPVLAQLERAAGFVRDDPPAAKLEKLEALLARAVPHVGEASLLLAELLGIPVEDRQMAELTPPQRRARTFAGLLAQLEGLAGQRPVVMLLEDAHWLDPTSIELFERIVDRIQRLPVLLLVTHRPEFDAPWRGYPHVTTLTLNRLAGAQAQAMVGHLTGGRTLPAELLDPILAKTEGVPLFVEELTKTVLESGLLREEVGGYVLCGPLPPLAIPATLQDSLMARLDRSASVKDVAQIAACIGREFDHEVLEAVADTPADRLEAALEELMRAELVFRRGIPPDATYAFKHALVQDAAYQSLLKSRRRQLHTRIAAVLEERFSGTEEIQPELLAHHYEQAGLIERAVAYWHLAGQLDMRRSAMAEAAVELSNGLTLLADLPPGPPRDRKELDLLLALASAHAAAVGHGTPEARRAYARAVELAEAVGDTTRLFPALDGLVTCHFSGGELRTAINLADRLLGLAETNEGVAPRLIAHSEVGIVQLALGNLASARKHLERALALYQPHEHDGLCWVYSFDPEVICRGYLSWTLFALGYSAQARNESRRSISAAQRLSHPQTMAFALTRAAALAHLHRSVEGVKKMAAAVTALANERGLRTYIVAGRFYQGWAAVQRGGVDEDLALLSECLGSLRAGGDEDWFPHSLCLAAEGYHKAGRLNEALDLLSQALERVERNDERWFAAEVQRLRGELLLSQSNADQAETCLRMALSVARDQGGKSWELRSATSLARLWAGQGRRSEARDLLAPIHAWFTEGFDSADLRDAKALLDQLA
jgi:class 3 adenylate cyclase/predicted ATPase